MQEIAFKKFNFWLLAMFVLALTLVSAFSAENWTSITKIKYGNAPVYSMNVPDSNRFVILTPGLGLSAESMKAMAAYYFANGISAYVVPTRIASDFQAGPTFDNATSDLVDTIRWVHVQCPECTGELLGFSCGGLRIIRTLKENTNDFPYIEKATFLMSADSPLDTGFLKAFGRTFDLIEKTMQPKTGRIADQSVLSNLAGQLVSKLYMGPENVESILDPNLRKKMIQNWFIGPEVRIVQEFYERSKKAGRGQSIIPGVWPEHMQVRVVAAEADQLVSLKLMQDFYSRIEVKNKEFIIIKDWDHGTILGIDPNRTVLSTGQTFGQMMISTPFRLIRQVGSQSDRPNVKEFRRPKDRFDSLIGRYLNRPKL